MFRPDTDFYTRIDQIMNGEDENRKNIFKAIVYASDEDIAAFQRIIDMFANTADKKRD